MLGTMVKEEFNAQPAGQGRGGACLPGPEALPPRLDHRRYNGASLLGLRGIVIRATAPRCAGLRERHRRGLRGGEASAARAHVAAMQPFVAQLERERRQSASAA